MTSVYSTPAGIKAMKFFITFCILVAVVHDVSGETWLSLGHHCYLIGQENLTFYDARLRCEDVEANLVQIDSILEDFFIASIIHSSSNQYWVDATRNRTSAPSLAYTWSDGTEVKKYLWISYEPNETGDCVRYYNAAGDTRNRLGDNPCTHNYSYICEKLAESPSTGSLGPFTEITNTSMCSLLRPTPSRSRVECGRVCLLTPECDGIVYQNNSCQLLRLAVINAVCDPYSVIPDSVYRLNRCGGEIGVNAIAG